MCPAELLVQLGVNSKVLLLDHTTTKEKTAGGDKVLWFEQISVCRSLITLSPALPIVARGTEFRSHHTFWIFSPSIN